MATVHFPPTSAAMRVPDTSSSSSIHRCTFVKSLHSGSEPPTAKVSRATSRRKHSSRHPQLPPHWVPWMAFLSALSSMLSIHNSGNSSNPQSSHAGKMYEGECRGFHGITGPPIPDTRDMHDVCYNFLTGLYLFTQAG